MAPREHLHSVVASLQPVIHGVSATDTGAPTPCAEWDVHRLAGHLLGTVEAVLRMGAGEPLDRDDPWGTGERELREDWRRELSDLLTAYAAAWSDPDAWEGDAMDGAVPRRTIGDIGFAEVLLHGWDLARGSGQDLEYDQAAVEAALEVMERIGQQGRAQGAFGAEVQVEDDAPAFHRVLARSGRDPHWEA